VVRSSDHHLTTQLHVKGLQLSSLSIKRKCDGDDDDDHHHLIIIIIIIIITTITFSFNRKAR